VTRWHMLITEQLEMCSLNSERTFPDFLPNNFPRIVPSPDFFLAGRFLLPNRTFPPPLIQFTYSLTVLESVLYENIKEGDCPRCVRPNKKPEVEISGGE
jgi:hypothetical protein